MPKESTVTTILTALVLRGLEYVGRDRDMHTPKESTVIPMLTTPVQSRLRGLERLAYVTRVRDMSCTCLHVPKESTVITILITPELSRLRARLEYVGRVRDMTA
jgi:hypothetical protein